MGDLRQHVDLQVGRERIGQSHVARECTENEVPHLDAVGWNDVAESIVVVAEELGKVMQQHEQHSHCALHKPTTGLLMVTLHFSATPLCRFLI